MKTETQAFLETLLWAYPENEDGGNPMDEKSVYDFSPEFIQAAESFLDGFTDYLEAKGIEIPENLRSFGGNVYFSLSGHGCGFWDTEETEHLQEHLEAYSGHKYRFEAIDLSEDENGKLDISFLPEFIDEYRQELFSVKS